MPFYQTTEFYVIAAVAAASVLGLCVRPSSRKAVVQTLLAGELLPDDPADNPFPPGEAGVVYRVMDDGRLEIIRHGVEMVGQDGAVSLAVETDRFDVRIEERIVPGRTVGPDTPVMKARFVLDGFGPERYHIRYNSDATGVFASVTFRILPGVTLRSPLRQ